MFRDGACWGGIYDFGCTIGEGDGSGATISIPLVRFVHTGDGLLTASAARGLTTDHSVLTGKTRGTTVALLPSELSTRADFS